MLPHIHLGSWTIEVYVLLYTVAIIVGAMVCFGRLLQMGRPPAVISRGVLLMILGGWAGSLLVRIIPTLQLFAEHKVLFWVGGSSSIGALLGGIGTWALYCRRQHLPLARSLDLASLPFPLSQAIGRLGCLAAGCCYGLPTSRWLGMYLPGHDNNWLPRYPTQLLSAAANLGCFFLLLWVDRRGSGPVDGNRRRIPDGFPFLLYLEFHFAERLAQEFLRGDVIPVLGPLSWVHLYGTAGLVLTTGLLAWNLVRHSSRGHPLEAGRRRALAERS